MSKISVRRMLSALWFGLGATASVGAQSPVVELFTSEGCSSCPPGEAMLSALRRETSSDLPPVLVLEWHVDYWDYLGWKDRFGSAEATRRQYQYARTLGGSVYTPQAIVNGSLVPRYAGDLAEVRILVARARQLTSAKVDLSVEGSSADGAVELRVKATGVPDSARLLAVLVEGGLGSRPSAGENAGRELTHSLVVRRSQFLGSLAGVFEFAIPPAVNRAQASVVVIVQDAQMRILASAHAELGAAALSSTGGWKGRILDRSGRAVVNTEVRVCSDQRCVLGATDSQGRFAFDALPPGHYTLSVGERELAQATLADRQLLVLADLVAP